MQSKKNQGQKWLNGIDSQIIEEATKNQRPIGMPPRDLIINYVTGLGYSEEDARYVYDCWLVNGFSLRSGKKIKDWRAAVRVWAAKGYLPSQKKANTWPTDKDRAQAAIDRMREGR